LKKLCSEQIKWLPTSTNERGCKIESSWLLLVFVLERVQAAAAEAAAAEEIVLKVCLLISFLELYASTCNYLPA
jgi:hypothetical protein